MPIKSMRLDFVCGFIFEHFYSSLEAIRDFYDMFQTKNHESDEVLSIIADDLPDAVDECIEAAGYVFSTNIQKNLIRSAYFGKGFIVGHNPEKYIKMCRILRVLNALRDPEIGIPLTYSQ